MASLNFGGPTLLVTANSTAATESPPLGANVLGSSGWTSTGWTGSFGAGFTHTIGNTNTLSNATALTAGAYYLLTFTISGSTAGLVTPALGGVTSVPNGGDIILHTTPTNGVTYFYGPFTLNTTGVSFAVTTDFDGLISNISLKQVTGSFAAAYALLASTGVNSFEIRSSPNSLGNSTFVGLGAGAQNSTNAYQNTALGAYAMASNVSGVQNTGVGYYSLNLNATGCFNTAMGHLSMASNTTGYDNAFFGDVAATANTTGKANAGFGNGVMLANTTGSNNSAFGNHALAANTTAGNNEAFGNLALTANTTGTRNSAFGTNAMATNVAGTDNCAYGNAAMLLWNSAVQGYNTAIGVNALTAATTCTNNTVVGCAAGQAITSGSNDVIVGEGAGILMTTAKNAVIIGKNAAPALVSGWYNTVVGGDSANIMTGQFNTFIGYGATSNAAGVTQSVAIGYTATTTANNQIMLGTNTETVVAPGVLTAVTCQPTSNASGALGKAATGWSQLYIDYTNTGTVGNVTISKAAGRVNLGAGQTTLTVTNTLCTAASHIFLNLDGAPGNVVAVLAYAIAGAGSFTVNVVPAVTNQTAIDFFIVNAD